MKTLLVVVLFFTSSSVYAFDDWTKTDYALQSVYTVLHVIDWGQTRYMSQHYQTSKIKYNNNACYYGKCSYTENTEYYEINPILGAKPHTSTVDLYFITTLIGHTVISYILPSSYRKVWQGVTIGLEGSVVGYNISAGIKGVF